MTVTAPAGERPAGGGRDGAAAPRTSAPSTAAASTDENTPTLTYSWNFGNGRTGSGALPTTTYTAAGTFTPTLTVRDEYGLTSTVTLAPLTITEPSGNVPPTAVITTPTCVGLVCNFSGATSSDPNTGDAFTYSWNFGDGGTSTSSSPSRTFAAAARTPSPSPSPTAGASPALTTRSVTVTP